MSYHEPSGRAREDQRSWSYAREEDGVCCVHMFDSLGHIFILVIFFKHSSYFKNRKMHRLLIVHTTNLFGGFPELLWHNWAYFIISSKMILLFFHLLITYKMKLHVHLFLLQRNLRAPAGLRPAPRAHTRFGPHKWTNILWTKRKQDSRGAQPHTQLLPPVCVLCVLLCAALPRAREAGVAGLRARASDPKGHKLYMRVWACEAR